MNKQKLQEQIDTMREELAKMETELAECEKVELCAGYCLHVDGNHSLFSADRRYVQNGATRATKELAEIASKNMVARNKLEAYAHQIDPEPKESCTYYVLFNKYLKRYQTSTDYYIHKRLTEVYMSKSTAEQICEWLNSGRIEL